MIVISKDYAFNMDYVIHWTTSHGGKGTTLTFADAKTVFITCDFDVFNDQYRMAQDDGLKIFWLEY